ncbi:MAG: hypothetical protein RSA22_11555 [Acinetobacter sp.]|jgi:hypothetical protein
MEISKQQLVGFVGALVLLIAVFMPVISVPILGNINLINNGKGDGYIICGLAILSIILVFFKKIRLLWLTSGLSLIIVIYYFYKITSKISETKAELAKHLKGNPFGGLAEAMMSSVQLQFGWVFLFLGCIILLLTPFLFKSESSDEDVSDYTLPNSQTKKNAIPNHSNIKVVGDPFYAFNSIQVQDNETKACPMCSETIRLSAIKCKHCGWLEEE